MVLGRHQEHTAPMTRATYQDAALLVELARWQTDCRLPAALSHLWIHGETPDREDEGTAALICAYFETIGTLHLHGLVNEELLFDWIDVAAVWDRVKPFVLAGRNSARMPALWAAFEALATAQKRHRGDYST